MTGFSSMAHGMAGTATPRAFLPDLARAAAAMMVLMAHALPIIFIPFRELGPSDIGWKMVYFVCSLGHQAVIVFFVLSGYLIGKEVLRQSRASTWLLSDYLIKRLVRLYVVLLPALVATALLDHIGTAWLNASIYNGTMDSVYSSTSAIANSSGWRNFLLNAVFLQTIAAPTFGSNNPLWSLANEFWYYIFFGTAVCCFLARANKASLALGAILIVGLCVVLPPWLTLYGIIWLFGVAAAALTLARPELNFDRRVRWLHVVLFVAAVCVSRIASRSHLPDFMMGTLCAAGLSIFRRLESPGAWLTRPIQFISDISYSLYLFHFPFICLASYWLMHEHQIRPGAYGLLLYVFLLAAAMCYSYLMYLCFERHTRKLQGKFLNMSFGRKGG
jgi:peptidoglycan/LPS O-acetylase OafA/YrhL